MKKNPKQYISEIKRISQVRAAGELGYTKEHFNDILNGKKPYSKKFIEKFCRWSDFYFIPADFF